MIDFKPLRLWNKPLYDRFLMEGQPRGCEYSFANLYLWGRQSAAVLGGHLVLFSRFSGKCVYPFPVGDGPLKPVIDAIMADARDRGIPCCLTGLVGEEKAALEALYPGKFRFVCARDTFDYVYDIDDLAQLRGKKLQKKRNHLNRFLAAHPDWRAEPLSGENVDDAVAFVERWYAVRQEEDPQGDYAMERRALNGALAQWDKLDMEGLLLWDGDTLLGVTLGNPLSRDTFDVNFEKARADVDGAYTAVNWAFARYLREKHPQLRFLNREDDLGLEGLRKAKLSYKPHHLVEKCWACLKEDECDA